MCSLKLAKIGIFISVKFDLQQNEGSKNFCIGFKVKNIRSPAPVMVQMTDHSLQGLCTCSGALTHAESLDASLPVHSGTHAPSKVCVSSPWQQRSVM